MPSVLLAAIHNGELSRSPAQVVVDEFREDEVVQRVIEVRDQPALSDAPDLTALRAWRRQQRLFEEHWRVYLGQPPHRIRAAAGEAAFSVRSRLSRAFLADAWRARQVERFVTAKHIQAWRALQSGGEDLLLVIESDAVIGSHSTEVLNQVAEVAGDGPLYVNLAGGLAWSDIAIDHLAGRRDRFLVPFTNAVTNTSCAYVINRPFAEAILEFIERDPSIESLGVDWVVNAFLMDVSEHGQTVECWHADPPALGHGSLTGVTRSWHPDR